MAGAAVSDLHMGIFLLGISIIVLLILYRWIVSTLVRKSQVGGLKANKNLKQKGALHGQLKKSIWDHLQKGREQGSGPQFGLSSGGPDFSVKKS